MEIGISNYSNLNKDSWSKFGKNYLCGLGLDKKESEIYLAGSEKFKVVEIEVFKIIWICFIKIIYLRYNLVFII